MSLSLFLASLWVLAATLIALLPMRMQFIPGLTVLILALPMLAFVAVQHGIWLCLLGVLAVLSMFRRPLIYYVGRLRGGNLGADS